MADETALRSIHGIVRFHRLRKPTGITASGPDKCRCIQRICKRSGEGRVCECEGENHRKAGIS